MIDWLSYTAFVLACAAVVIVPGPTVTVIIANSLRHGARSGLLNVAGTQAGLALMLLIVVAGLELLIENLSFVFEWIRLIGAAYLIWLGIQLLRLNGRRGDSNPVRPRRFSFFWQGFLVIWSNPKACHGRRADRRLAHRRRSLARSVAAYLSVRCYLDAAVRGFS